MTSGELSEQADVSVSTIYRLEKQGILKPERNYSGWRVFDKADVQKLRDLYKKPVATSHD